MQPIFFKPEISVIKANLSNNSLSHHEIWVRQEVTQDLSNGLNLNACSQQARLPNMAPAF